MDGFGVKFGVSLSSSFSSFYWWRVQWIPWDGLWMDYGGKKCEKSMMRQKYQGKGPRGGGDEELRCPMRAHDSRFKTSVAVLKMEYF